MIDTSDSRKSILLLLAMAAIAIMVESIGMGVSSIAAKRRNIVTQREALARESARSEVVAAANTEMEKWLPACLPGDVATSTNIYQQSLLQHADDVGVHDIVVRPGTAKPSRDIGYRIPCQISGTMTASQFGAYLDRIYGMDLMQKVTRLDIVDASRLQDRRSSDMKRITIQIEAIAAAGAKHRAEIVSHATTMSLEKLFQQRPLFTRYEPAVVRTLPVAKTMQPTVENKPIDPLVSVRYVASFSKRGVWQAWLYDGGTKKQYTVTQGARIVAGDRTLRVLDVGEDYIEVEIDRAAARIQLGQLLIAAPTSTL